MYKIVFWVYCVFVLAFVVFKINSPSEMRLRVEYFLELKESGIDNVNPIPFNTIKMYISNIHTLWATVNLLGNTLPFLFLGRLAEMAWRKTDRLALTAALSMGIVVCEALQYFFMLGTCDIDDVLLNTLFLLIGIYSPLNSEKKRLK